MRTVAPTRRARSTRHVARVPRGRALVVERFVALVDDDHRREIRHRRPHRGAPADHHARACRAHAPTRASARRCSAPSRAPRPHARRRATRPRKPRHPRGDGSSTSVEPSGATSGRRSGGERRCRDDQRVGRPRVPGLEQRRVDARRARSPAPCRRRPARARRRPTFGGDAARRKVASGRPSATPPTGRGRRRRPGGPADTTAEHRERRPAGARPRRVERRRRAPIHAPAARAAAPARSCRRAPPRASSAGTR